MYKKNDFQNKNVPTNLSIIEKDFVLITGDAYIDHPSYGSAIISKILENDGFTVGIIAQPNWHESSSIMSFGKPKLGFLVTAGNMDSMVSHYTVNKKRRHRDNYTPGGVIGKRPDRATIVYCGLVRQVYGKIPIIIGGIEASLRRFAHYDYWQDTVRRSIIFDSRADLLVYGMGEKAMLEIARALKTGSPVNTITNIKGTAYISKEKPRDSIVIPSYELVKENKVQYAYAAKIINGSNDPYYKKTFTQQSGDRYLIQNIPQMPLSQEEMDNIYNLPYNYMQDSNVEKTPSIDEIKFSITANRGCFGSCSFCALAIHQGRYIQSRSKHSILAEANKMIKDKEFKGYIHDVGGPTANFMEPACKKQKQYGVCRKKECLHPKPCKHLDVSHEKYVDILQALREIESIKKVFIRSGVRYDYLLLDKNKSFIKQLIKHHVSGQLRVAPEHNINSVLEVMGKPSIEIYDKFEKQFNMHCKLYNSNQYLVPYFISGHPGCTLEDAVSLAEYLHKKHAIPEQVQDFYPTPGSISTAMYYTEINPFTMESIYIPKGREKNLQRALIQFNRPENRDMVIEALEKVGRTDLIGNSKEALVKRSKPQKIKQTGMKQKNKMRKVYEKRNGKNERK